MYNRVTTVDNTVLYNYNLLRKQTLNVLAKKKRKKQRLLLNKKVKYCQRSLPLAAVAPADVHPGHTFLLAAHALSTTGISFTGVPCNPHFSLHLLLMLGKAL